MYKLHTFAPYPKQNGMKRIQIDLPETVIDNLRAIAIRNRRKLKPYIELVLTEVVSDMKMSATIHEKTTQEQPAQLAPDEVNALRALLSVVGLSKGLQ